MATLNVNHKNLFFCVQINKQIQQWSDLKHLFYFQTNELEASITKLKVAANPFLHNRIECSLD